MKFHLLAPMVFLSGVASVIPATADTVLFTSGNVTNLMAAASRPATGGNIEIEAADDFVLANNSNISSASFTGWSPVPVPALEMLWSKSTGYSRPGLWFLLGGESDSHLHRERYVEN